jgi:high-affinity iron transporter
MKNILIKTFIKPRRQVYAWLAVILALGMVVPGVGGAPAGASSNQVWQAASEVRSSLLRAQTALLGGDTTAGSQAIRDAQATFEATLAPSITASDSHIADAVRGHLQAAAQAATANAPLLLAGARGLIWGKLLHGSQSVVLSALQADQLETAQAWIVLREFRPSTRFSRASAETTLILDQLQRGDVAVADAVRLVRDDLLDTTQARLNATLADIETAQHRELTMRQAELAGLATAYFDMLAATYAQDEGPAQAEAVRALFGRLVLAANQGAADDVDALRLQLQAALSGFRAVPLTPAEQARRAGQLLRYLPLIAVEYGRGVHQGQITNEIEIQEALTFLDGAQAAFADIQATLVSRDAQAAERIAGVLTDIRIQIREVADVQALTHSVEQVITLVSSTAPTEWLAQNSDADLDVIRTVLDQIRASVSVGQYAQAETARIEAYALLDSGVEQRLRGFAPDLALRIEALFWQGELGLPGLAVMLAERAPAEKVRVTLNQLDALLIEASNTLNNSSVPAVVITNAAVIVFREGLEAVLILASLIASLRTAQTRKFRQPILVGAVLALGASALTWWVANTLLMQLTRFGERLEAIVSLLAIAVLLIITNWFFHKVYWTGWIANFHQRKGRLLMGGLALGQALGLVVLGFSSIYREGFETVLFLQSLVLDAGLVTVLEGVGLGLVGVAVVGVITFSFQVKLPYKKMLVVTGIMIGAVLLIMVGNTVHVMQAVGWLPITPIQGVFVPHWMGQWFGLWATWQGVVFQAAAAIFVIGSYFLAEYQHKAALRHPANARTPKKANTTH